MEVLNEISQALQNGDADLVGEKAQEALNLGVSPSNILSDGLLKGMGIIGAKFKNNEVFVPEVLIAARAMHFGLNVLKPILANTGVKPFAKVVLGTVKGDLHDIGKNLVGMVMMGSGLEVVDVGIDVHEDKFIEAIKEHKPDILALSSLLSTTMVEQKTVIDTLIKEGLRDQVKVMIGGAPVTEQYCKDIGADGYATDAVSAAEMARKLV
ncbi:MAG: methyltransferase [Clostridiaceae bacterium BRH_c20a]|nr:MAG: methyltransferase [Clostridiaceae bacterium BRH_c20a]